MNREQGTPPVPLTHFHRWMCAGQRAACQSVRGLRAATLDLAPATPPTAPLSPPPSEAPSSPWLRGLPLVHPTTICLAGFPFRRFSFFPMWRASGATSPFTSKGELLMTERKAEERRTPSSSHCTRKARRAQERPRARRPTEAARWRRRASFHRWVALREAPRATPRSSRWQQRAARHWQHCPPLRLEHALRKHLPAGASWRGRRGTRHRGCSAGDLATKTAMSF